MLYRQGCDHCAKYLRELAGDAARNDGSTPIALLQIKDDLKDGRAVDAMPQGAHVTQLELREGPKYVITPPWELTIAGGTITAAVGEQELEAKQATSH